MAEEFRCGHPRSLENSAPNGKAAPICRTCKNARKRRTYDAALPESQPIERPGPGQRRCDVDECDALHLARGKCRRHYSEAVRQGVIPSARRGECSEPGCARTVRARGLCRGHYQVLMRSGAARLLQKNAGSQCSESGCIEPARSRGMCSQHYNYWRTVERYGLTRTTYDAMVAMQGSRCAICATTEPGADRWFIDHDHGCCPGTHSCGACVRGLLCRNCNSGLGMFADEPDRLLAAAAYLLARTDLLRVVSSHR